MNNLRSPFHRLSFCLLFLLMAQGLRGQSSSSETFSKDTADIRELGDKVGPLFYKGSYLEATEICQQVLEKVERVYGKEHEEYGTWLDNTGVLLHHAGKLNQALPYLEAGVQHAASHLGKNHEDYMTRLNNLGMLYKDLGEYGKALNAIGTAVEVGKRSVGEGNQYYPVLVNNLALAYEAIGQNEQALANYQQALELTEKITGKDHIRYATRLNNLASIYWTLGQYEKALNLYEEGLRIMERKVGREHPQTTVFLANIGRTYTYMNEFGKALELAKEVVVYAEKNTGRQSPDYVKFLMDIAIAEEGLGHYEQAKTVLLDAAQISTEVFGINEYWPKVNVLFSCLAIANEGIGDLQASARYHVLAFDQFIRAIQASFDQLGQHDEESFLDSWYPTFDRAFTFALQNPEQPEIIKKSFDIILQLKGLTLGYRRRLLQSLQSSKDFGIRQAYEEWRTLNIEISKQLSLPQDKRKPDFKTLLERSETAERRLAQQSSPFREARQVLQWQDVQERLKEGEAAIEICKFHYAPFTKNSITDSVLYVAFILTKNVTAPRIIYLFEEKELKDLQATRRMYGLHNETKEKTLYELVWAPLKAELSSISTLYYAPSGLLHQVNFGAIPFNETQTLGQHYKLLQLGSTRQLALKNEEFKQNSPQTAAIYGGIIYDTPSPQSKRDDTVSIAESFRSSTRFSVQNQPWSYLKWTEKEAKSIGLQLKKAGASVSLLQGHAATEEMFKHMGDAEQAPGVLHIATHGFYFSVKDESGKTGFSASAEPMARCGLALAHANDVWMGGLALPGQEDGILTAQEISMLDLKKTELVVLSACGTGLGKSRGNEGIYGLQRAFKMAGARYILMSLWDVPDHQTEEFMVLFYQEWLEKKQEIPQAFQLAQNKMKEKYAKPFNPGLWAGFILVN